MCVSECVYLLYCAYATSDERIVRGHLSRSLDQELNEVTMTPETSTSTPAASCLSLVFFFWFFYALFDLLELLCLYESMYQHFHVLSHSHTLFFFFILCLPFLTRQPACGPGKVSLTTQHESPSSMITCAYRKTLDKCQRGLQRGDLGDS